MRYCSLAGGAALTGSAFTIWAGWVPTIPSWHRFNFFAPMCVSVASIVAIVLVLWCKNPEAARKWWQRVLRGCVTLLLVTIVMASLWVAVITAAFAPRVERTYTFEGLEQPLYLVENSCFPPDSKSECNDSWTDIRTPMRFLPFMRTISHCRCFYGKPQVTALTVTFPIEETYEPATSPAVLDRRTLRLLVGRTGR
jgi:hypothetical protein